MGASLVPFRLHIDKTTKKTMCIHYHMGFFLTNRTVNYVLVVNVHSPI